MTVCVHGTGIIPFGRYPDRTLEDLAVPAAAGALAEAAATGDGIDAVYCGNVYGGMLPAHRIAARLGLTGRPAYNVEAACSSSAVALHLAVAAIRAGQLETALVIGVEQLSVFGRGTLRLNADDPEIAEGLTMPAAYAMRAQRYRADFGAAEDAFDMVTVKNRANGALNPRAHFQQPVTLEQVRDSRPVADPLRLLHCCPNTDGAAAILLCSQDFAKSLGTATVRVLASVVRSGAFHTGYRDMTWPDITYRAAEGAYQMSGVGPSDLDLVELHDAFSVSELLHAEALGLAERGQAHRRLADGDYHRDGKTPINPSGGLMSRGHPVGATGVMQICESYWQLTGQAGSLQLPNPRIALTHVTGGGIFGVDNGACSVHILAAD